MKLATISIATSAGIVLVLGLVHLFYTFIGTKLFPADPAVVEAMRTSKLVITRETSVWQAWTGFNATHSIALILFGLIYGYLAVFQSSTLFNSTFLQLVGFAMLASLIVLSWNYFFSIPLAGVSAALLFYTAGLIAGYTR